MRTFALAVVVAGLLGAGPAGFVRPACAGRFDGLGVQYWTGSGANEAVMCVDWKLGGSPTLVFGYRWATGETKTGGDMLSAIDAASSRFHLELLHYSFGDLVDGIGWDVDDDGFSKSDVDDYWRPGWVDPDYWGYFTSTDGLTWDYSAVGMADRQLSHGDWDGWAYSAGLGPNPPPELAPEPATLVLVGGGIAAMFGRRRVRRAK